MTLQLAELTRLIAEWGASLERMGQVVIEAETPVIEPDPVEEFIEVGGFTHV